MKIGIATDHAGFTLKETLVVFLEGLGHEVEDFGAHELDAQDDYPDFIHKVADAVENSVVERAIVLGKSGQGEAMVANRHPGVRAVVYYSASEDIIRLSREHNNANVLSLGAGFLSEQEAREAVKLWLATDFLEEKRHQRRINKIDSI